MSARACSKSEGGKGTRQASQSERVKREGRENDPIQRQKTEKQSERDTHIHTHTFAPGWLSPTSFFACK